MPEQEERESEVQTELLKKILMVELFKLGLPQGEIGKKLKIKTVTVNSFLKGIKRKENAHGES